MSLLLFTDKGIYCPAGGFYIDPWQPVDYAVITHAHGDHARFGCRHYLAHDASRPLLQARLGDSISVESLPYGQAKLVNGVKLSLHPSAHITGAAQIRLEHKGFVSVVSGDYKTENDGLSGAFELVKCHEFVTESTFGLPIYNWLPQQQIFQNIRSWILHNQARSRTSIFVAYSLGKAQRLIKGLEGAGRIFVHSSIMRMNNAIESAGIPLPSTMLWNPEMPKAEIQNNIVIVPPSLLGTNMIKKIPAGAIAVCSGWMQVRGNRRWQSVDAGFALSDHADWEGLQQVVKETGAEKVYVTHGYTATFSKYLNEIGISAAEVSTQYGADEEGETTTAGEGPI